MKLRSILLGVLLLDVAVFPYSCSSKRDEQVVFCGDYVNEEENISYYRTHYVDGLPKDRVIEIPLDLDMTINDYYISYWYLYNDEDMTPVEFPYTYKDEDLVGYFRGPRDAVVFLAHWEKVDV